MSTAVSSGDLKPLSESANSADNKRQKEKETNPSIDFEIAFWDKIEPLLSHHRGTTVAISIAYSLFGLSHFWSGNWVTAAALLAPVAIAAKVAYPQKNLYLQSFLKDVWEPAGLVAHRLGQRALALFNAKAA